MDPYELFREELQTALTHLHDPDYEVPTALAEVIAGKTVISGSSVQYAIIEAIRKMVPPPGTPASASIQRNYALLVHRFVENLTQAETAERLHTTERNIRRKQRVAIHMLARSIWEHSVKNPVELAEHVASASPDADVLDASSGHWRAQVRRELTSLRESDPAATANVGNAVRRAVALEQDPAAGYGVTLTVREIAADLTAAVHPIALQQILIMSISQLSRSSQPCEIRVDAWEEDGFTVIRLWGAHCSDRAVEEDAVTTEMLHLFAGALTTTVEGGSVYVTLRVPTVGQVDVAIIDDNQDFVHFCRRCAHGTRFRIVHINDWTVDAIRKVDPDVILLDIMLPRVDGWDLLDVLQHDPVTTEIPVIICSIVREETLASLMGAVEYLPKPIQHQDLITTLERVAGRSRLAPA